MFALSFLSQELVILLIVHVVGDQGEHQMDELVTDIVDDKLGAKEFYAERGN